MPTTRQLKEFEELVSDQVEIKMPSSILETATQWIKDNLDPDDIFDEDTLRTNVSKSSLPDDVFEEKDLQAWAESNGYTKE